MRLQLLVLIALSFTFACHSLSSSSETKNKHDQESVPYRGDSLFGDWKLIKRTGGFAGISTRMDSSGIGLQIGVDSIYTWEGGKLLYQESYRRARGKAIGTSGEAPLLELRNKKVAYFFIRDTLVLQDQCYDCFTHYYIRSKR